MKNYSKPSKPKKDAPLQKHLDYAQKSKEYDVAVLIAGENKKVKTLIAGGKFAEAETLSNRTMKASALLESGDTEGAKRALSAKSSGGSSKPKGRGVRA